MFKPCNYSLERLAEIHEEQHQRNHAHRSQLMSQARMREGTADFLERYEAAVKACIEKLRHIEQHHPHLLETTQ